ncbi:hypothetical protein DPMN_023750 [Dreissena polymorpha]|uniref:Uncharacterized protein n=1 Tax=Dreissena polymorpha TaxID=45954 RepID=A0A9D4LLA2_DREPO|nr:hypothetical protein DPMN_023750 [Dreissena polymorpha]
MHKRLSTSMSSSLKHTYQDLKKHVKYKLRKAFHFYLNDMLDPVNDRNSKSFWKYIRSRKQDAVDISTLKNEGFIADTAKGKANLLNKLLTSVFRSSEKKISPTSPLKDHLHLKHGPNYHNSSKRN